MPTKWLQERAKGSKNEHGIAFEEPGVVTQAELVRGAVADLGTMC